MCLSSVDELGRDLSRLLQHFASYRLGVGPRHERFKDAGFTQVTIGHLLKQIRDDVKGLQAFLLGLSTMA